MNTSGKTDKGQLPDYEKIFDLRDGKINVLLLGTSGAGKSTLINGVLCDEYAQTGEWRAITDRIRVYQKDDTPIRMIDTVGFEFSKKQQRRIRKELKAFIKGAVKERSAESLMHMIWLCIDGTVRRLDPEILEYTRDIARVWEGIPIIVVITKSYSEPEIEENVENIRRTLGSCKRAKDLNIKSVIPVVAKAYPVDEDHIVRPMGLDVLVDSTLKYGPEGLEKARTGAKQLDARIKKSMAYSLIAANSAAAGVVGMVPVPVPDAAILVPLQTRMIKKISGIFGIKSGIVADDIAKSLLKAGAVTMLAKQILNYLKGIPVLAAAGVVLNAAVAGLITLIMGSVCAELAEGVFLGKIDPEKTDWLQEASKLYGKHMPKLLDSFGQSMSKVSDEISADQVFDIIKKLLFKPQKDEGEASK
ncbi:MAG: GTPase domain-containing protein [Firmicutes bacterium]|nr:GTPase domain-containing protein [Bacillota bacterium]